MSFLKEKLEIYADKTIFTVDEMEECFQRIPKNLPEYFKHIPKKIFSEEMQTEDMSKNTV